MDQSEICPHLFCVGYKDCAVFGCNMFGVMLVYPCTEVAWCCVQENFKKHGLRALDLTSEFEERLVLETNRVYLCNTLEVRNRSPCTLLLLCLVCLLSSSLLSLFLHCYSDCPCSYSDCPCSYVHVLTVTVLVLTVTVLVLTVTVLVLMSMFLR